MSEVTENEIRAWLRSIGLEPYQHSLDAGMIDLVALLVGFASYLTALEGKSVR